MTVEIAPRYTETVFCPVVGHCVDHVIITLDNGPIRWCQTCYYVLDLAEWEDRCGASEED